MAHSLAPSPPAVIISKPPKKNAHFSCFCSHKVWSCHQSSGEALGQNIVTRRSIALGLGGVVLGLKAVEGSANAAARRPPAPPAEEKEKKDPNVSGVMAKVLASKKRKEAMKESIAKLREKGNPITE